MLAMFADLKKKKLEEIILFQIILGSNTWKLASFICRNHSTWGKWFCRHIYI